MEKEENDYTTTFCPSFSSYTNNGLAETAERVRLELSAESNDNDDSFEFVNLLKSDFETTSSLAFPMFNQVIVSKTKKEESSQLKDLFLRDRDDQLSSSSSSSSSSDEEEDELDGISSEIYCPWTPEKSNNRGWRKSKSTGSSSSSSRRWRIRDLLKRSYSEGKQSLSFGNRDESSSSSKKEKEKEKVSSSSCSSAHEKFYLKNKAMKEEEKRRSYLPYKKDLVGLFFFNLHRRYYGKTLPSSSSS